MSKWSEKDMDKLFQQGSEQYDFEYNPEAWQNMEQLLERAERRRRWFWWWLGAGIALAVGLLLGTNFLSSPEKELEARQALEILSENNEPSQEETKPGLQEKGPFEKENSGENTKPKLSEGESEVQETAKAGKQPSGTFSSPKNVNSISPNANINEWTKSKPAADSSGLKNELRPSPKSINAPEENEAFLNGDSLGSVPQVEPQLFGLAVLPSLKIQLEHEVVERNEPSIATDSSEIDVLKKTTFPGSPALLFGFSGGTEWNSVGFGDFTQRNWKFGVHGEYRLREKFGTGLGLTWMRMDYDAGRNEYVPEEDFWVDGIAPESTFGRCDMLEIPLEFSYHVNGFRSDGWFFSAGLSSYWILEEHYWYHYDAPQPDFVFYWGTQKDERNFLSLGHFSFAYQKRISPKTSFSVGPYAQFPLVGVGHGAVKIFSIGLSAKADFWVK